MTNAKAGSAVHQVVRKLAARRRSWADRARARRLAALYGFACGPRVGIEPGVRVVLEIGGQLSIGARSHVSSGTVLHAAANAELLIGPETFIGQNCVLMSKERVTIGTRVAMAESVSIRDHDHVLGASPHSGGLNSSPVVVEDDVWIAAKATITRGCRLGRNCTVGAGAVVTRDVHPNTVVVGVPARPIVRTGS